MLIQVQSVDSQQPTHHYQLVRRYVKNLRERIWELLYQFEMVMTSKCVRFFVLQNLKSWEETLLFSHR